VDVRGYGARPLITDSPYWWNRYYTCANYH
jgi:hypothetical protein